MLPASAIRPPVFTAGSGPVPATAAACALAPGVTPVTPVTVRRLALLLVLGLAAMAALPAPAATVSFTDLPQDAVLNPVAADVSGQVFQNTTGSVGGLRRSPWESANSPVNYLASGAYYSSVSGGASMTFSFGRLMQSLSFVWGSPDSYNTLSFLLGGTVIDTLVLGSSDAIAPASFGTDSALARITAIGTGGSTSDSRKSGDSRSGGGSAGGFDAVRFGSGNNAFEFANLRAEPVPEVAAVPLPAAGLLLFGALAGLGALRLWRRNAA